jgi:hypothetical protein
MSVEKVTVLSLTAESNPLRCYQLSPPPSASWQRMFARVAARRLAECGRLPPGANLRARGIDLQVVDFPEDHPVSVADHFVNGVVRETNLELEREALQHSRV